MRFTALQNGSLGRGLGRALLTLVLASGCAAPTARLGSEDPERDYARSQAEAAAFAADGFTFRKEQKIRPKNDFDFYFKRCLRSDDQTFYSKTSYWCEDPF